VPNTVESESTHVALMAISRLDPAPWCGTRVKALARCRQPRQAAGMGLPASHDDVAIGRVEFEPMASPPGPLAGHQGRAAATDLRRHMAGGPDRAKL
jgi:hypothetical protein